MRILVATDFSAGRPDGDPHRSPCWRAGWEASCTWCGRWSRPRCCTPRWRGAEIEGMEIALARGVKTQLAQAAAPLRAEGLVVREQTLFGFPEQVVPGYARTAAAWT